MARIFDIDLERSAMRPRNLRPELPYPYPGTMYPWQQPFGPTIAPRVSEMQTLGLPAAWRALNMLANGVAGMAPLGARDSKDHRTTVDAPNVFTRPNSSFDVFDFWHLAVCQAVMHGNFVGLLEDFDGMGYARQVIPLPAQFVEMRYSGAGFIEYDIPNVGTRYSDDVVHVRGFSVPGTPRGIGVVENFRRSFGLALEQQHMAADVYHRGSVPSGVITTDRPQQDRTQAEDIQEQWIESQGGGQRKPAVLPQGWTFNALSWSPEDAQFLQSRQFTVGEIAHMFNLDPSDLGASLAGAANSITYANIEQREIARVTDSYGPWMLRFEQAWTDLAPASIEAWFDVDKRLRTDSKTRAEVHQLNIATQVETVDEARAADGRPELPKKDVLPLAVAAPVPPPSPEQVPGTDIEVKPVSVKL